MKKLLAILVLGLLLSGCKSWHEVTQIVDKRDTRTNFYNGDFNMIYVGVGSDKEEKLKAYFQVIKVQESTKWKHAAKYPNFFKNTIKRS